MCTARKMVLSLFCILYTTTILSGCGSSLVKKAKMGDLEKVKTEINKGANVNKLEDGIPPLVAAAENGHTDVVKVLLDANAQYKGMALRSAASNGNLGTVRLLLDSGAEVDAQANAYIVKQNQVIQSASGFTPLALAVSKQHWSVAKELLKHGANPHKWVVFENASGGTIFSQGTIERLAESKPLTIIGEGKIKREKYTTPEEISEEFGVDLLELDK